MSKIITGREAIQYAEQHSLTINKYADPIEVARDGLTIAEAIEVAREDPALVWVEVKGDEHAPGYPEG